MAQTVYVPAPAGDTKLAVDVLVEIGAADPAQLRLADLRRMTRELLGWGWDITAFESPWQERYAYGDVYLNLRHPTVQLLFRIACVSRTALESGQISEADAGRMGDRLAATSIDSAKHVKHLPQRLREAFDFARSLRLIDIDIDSIAFPQPDDFVPGTIVERDSELKPITVRHLMYFNMHSQQDASEFGMPLS